MTASDLARRHPLATQSGIASIIAMLLYQGAICPDCAYGTRVKSKRWAVCKKCGKNIERRKLPEATP